jgi:hypothetical protein
MTSGPRLLVSIVAAAALLGCAAEHAALAPSRARSVALVRCTLLIPLRYNDGTPVPERELKRTESRLFDRFGGYTTAGRVRGAFRMADGTRAEDESLVIWVAVPATRVAELRAEAAWIAREMRQESIYFEHPAGTVELIPVD